MSLRFVPPAEDKPRYRYASYAAGTMKLHGSIGAAKNSLNNRMWTFKETDEMEDYYGTPRKKRVKATYAAALLENIDGTWYTLYDVKEGSEFKDLPWVKQYYKGGYGYSWSLVDDYFRESKYHQDKVKEGAYTLSYRNTAITMDEYVAFRLAVERENRGVVLPLHGKARAS